MSVTRHRFTVEEYHKMGEVGIFSEDDRVELIDGEVVEMAAIGERHVESVMRLTRLLSRWALLDTPAESGDAEFLVSPQSALRLSSYGEPQPDLVLVRRRIGRAGTPVPGEALLVVEVSDTSLAHDRERKLPLYAGAGIPEAWIVNLSKDRIEAYSAPGTEGYGAVARYERGQRVVAATIEGLDFAAEEVLPPEGAE